jgi:hypothetical protein
VWSGSLIAKKDDGEGNRGYWFYIASDDVKTRAVLAIFEILFALQESGEKISGPLLTLPVGG